ncbi:cell surface protein [Lactiplantibacillus pentosus]|uniref:lectin-like domain-containing protein n=1 Tax=Lactiplantibacillus pentosus TaxID=1589 RepID=UPI000EA8E00F|nr:cell surface protein [Lactiplantibacillus pentosus]AYG38650.1 cell surface protein [Lactiplantibacillus pentosus]AYG41310.1 cell surface protein [Lactiplantibacillus pentosus]
MWKGPKQILVALAALTGLWAGTAQIQAADEASLATAPSGLNQLDKLFTLPAAFNSGVTNSASIANVTNASSPNTQAIQVINGKKQMGGFWSNDANRFDINKDATFKMWLYLGSSTSTSKAGDGMAFVLQNDPNGTTASAQVSSSSIIGETLGVWGVDTNNKLQDGDEFAKTAIQNSWALEFDTYTNTSTGYSDAGKGDAFDNGIKKQHIATGYPGSASQYINNSVKSLDITGIIWSTRYFFTQTHHNLVTTMTLGDSKWHHLVMNWNAASKTMTYTFDDVNPDGSATGGGLTQSEVLDTSKFNSSDGLMRWGFMGATGSNSGNNMVVIESAPNLVDVSAAVKVTDKTKNREITTGSQLKAKHKVQYDYQLTYQSGQLDWDNITAELNLPKYVTFDSAKVTYADGSEQALTAPTADATKVDYSLNKALSASQKTATITLTGTANDVTVNQNTTVTSATFKNKVFETSTEAPDYLITVDQPMGIYIRNNPYTVANGEDVTIKGIVAVENSEQLTNDKVTLHPTVNGQEMPTVQMSNDEESRFFSYKIKASQLHVGNDNKLEIWASDPYENESPVGVANITVTGGELSFKSVSKNSTFKSITLDGQAQTTDREDDWQLVVRDSRGKGSSWQLQASATNFKTTGGQTLAGDVLFREGDKTTVLNSNGTVIDSHTTTSDNDDYDVLSDWTSKSGILYRSNAGAVPGSYTGDITWTLTDAPK